ncbi:MAG TPA: tripartite tricarboxylate transporter substrate binding protein [Burkholderiales bacterium]|nr:tripartite tricarboxylate transporter substrate binding protein [Burkholderiales bacterium]
MTGKTLILMAVSVMILVSPTGHAAEIYPNRPVRMVISNGPGSAGDILGRIAFMRATEILGQPLIVDNRPGAGGTIGVEIVARAAPDGYTLLATSFATLAVAPHTYKNVPYHPVNDFAPVSLFAITQAGLCVNAALPVKSTRELIDLARARPGKLLMASAGIGSTSHLAGLMFATAAGIDVTHVPYKGGGPSAAALAAGEAHWALGPLAAYAVPWKTGRARCIAVSGENRSAIFPELPTIAEAGVPGFKFLGWNGVLAPKGTPRPLIDRLHGALVQALKSSETRQSYAVQGDEPAWTTPEDYAKIIREDYEHYGKVVKQAGVRAE